ncbi:MAG: methyltransferase domain-containing protein, partial [Bdellovibrionales bacterium]|nr:methyltransferase domain-containing protein [Bdellovibrionales bacterium]
SLMGKILFCPQKLIRYRKHGKNLVGPRVKPSALIFMKPHVFISEAKKQWRTTKELKRIMANHIFSSTSKFYCERKINWDGLKEDRSLQNIVSYFFKDVIRFTKIYFISVGGVLNYLEGLFFRGKGKGSFESTQIAGPYSQKEFNEFLNYHKYLLNKSWKGELYRNFYLYPLLKKSLKGRVLDIGCGIGDFLRSRPKTLGIDINPYNIEMCHDKGLPACLVSSYDYPFSDKEFDGAIIDNVLEHLEDPAPMLSEVNRVMKIGGVVVIGVPGIKGFEADSDHKIYYDPKRLEDTAFRFGFKLKKIMHLPFKSKYLEENFKRYIYYGAFEKVDDYKI